jgi:hypothetical protein
MGNDLVVREVGLIQSLSDAERAAEAMAASGYFQDARQAAQAVVKVLAGHEMGFGPFASMNGIYIIQGRPAVSANLLAAAVKRSGKYDYRVTEMTETRCAITFYQNGQPIGESTFTIEDARKAGTKNLDKFARNMLFARCISNGVRWYCPDVFNGSAVYTPDELGATEDEDGRVIDVKPTPVRVEKPAPKPAPPTEKTAAILYPEKPAEPPQLGGMADIEAAAAQAATANSAPQENPFETADLTNPYNAIQWGLAAGAFDHEKHANAAYAKLKREHNSATSAELVELWKVVVAAHLANKSAAQQESL